MKTGKLHEGTDIKNEGAYLNFLLHFTLIGQLAVVHICDWLTKDKQIHKLSSIIFMGWGQSEYDKCHYFYRFFLRSSHLDSSKEWHRGLKPWIQM